MKRLFILPFGTALLILFFCGTKAIAASHDLHYREVINALKWGSDSVIVVGHRHPDCDATCSAIAYANLMNAIGHKCAPRVVDPINNEMRCACRELGIVAPLVQDSLLPGQQLILTDHSNYAQAIPGARDAQILQIVDHHNMGDVTTKDPVYAKSMPVGSCCTIVYTCYKELDVPISDDMAKVLLTGIISDTKKLKTAGILNDSIALYDLAAQLHMSDAQLDTLNKHMRLASESYPPEMTDSQIYESDYKNYPAIGGTKIAITTLYWHDRNTIEQFLQRVAAVSPAIMKKEGTDMTFAMVHCYKPNTAPNRDYDYLEDGTYLVYCGTGAKAVAEKAYGQSVGEAWVYSAKPQTRKGGVYPKLEAAIRSLK